MRFFFYISSLHFRNITRLHILYTVSNVMYIFVFYDVIDVTKEIYLLSYMKLVG